MSRKLVGDWCVIAAGAMLTLSAGKTLFGCDAPNASKTAADLPLESAAASVYLAEQLACVDEGPTRNAAQACINAVRARWAATAIDGGAE